MDTIIKYFKENLLKVRPEFEIRDGQVEMGQEVAKYLDSKDNFFIEAGTGVGKSLAYLIPASLWAIRNNEKVVIATYSKALQNQLLEKDLPLVQEIFGQEEPLKVSMVKGRTNYICLRRLKNAADGLNQKNDLEQIRLWDDDSPEKKKQLEQALEVSEEGIGEKDFIDFAVDLIWDDICSQRFNCLKHRCPWKNKCFVNQARYKQADSHLIIVNHALYFADLALKSSGNSLIPKYSKVIFDEAHHLEDVIADSYAIEMNIFKIRNFSQLMVNTISNFGQAVRLEENIYNELKTLRKEVEDQAAKFFEDINYLVTSRNHATYEPGQIQDVGLTTSLKNLIKYIEAPELTDILQLTNEGEGEKDNIVSTGKQLLEEIQFLAKAASVDYVYWAERDDLGYTILKSCPIHPGNILQVDLFNELNALFTSATLTTYGSFKYMAERLGVENYAYKICLSPFDYLKQCLLITPKRGINPKSPDYNDYIVQCCKYILPQTKGRAFVLFTSYSSLNYCYDKLYDWLIDEGMEPMAQGKGITPYRLIEKYKHQDMPVLFGTSSFWEGMDVPGDKLTCVIVTKLPFAVPSHPVEAARMNKLKEKGINDFIEYSVPKAVIKFKQGFGRLIRSCTDKGVVVVTDPRIKQNSYGKYFLESLPDVSKSNYLKDIEKFLK